MLSWCLDGTVVEPLQQASCEDLELPHGGHLRILKVLTYHYVAFFLHYTSSSTFEFYDFRKFDKLSSKAQTSVSLTNPLALSTLSKCKVSMFKMNFLPDKPKNVGNPIDLELTEAFSS